MHIVTKREIKYSISQSMVQALYYHAHNWQQSHNKSLYYGFKDAILSSLVTMYQEPGA